MKISVITVCFNSANTIARALQSVAAQTWPDVEHIVVDGVSTDGTMQVVAKHRASLAHVLCEPDKGIYDAMNKGLNLATGDLVAFLNADDFYKDAAVLSRVARVVQDGPLDDLYGDGVFLRSVGTVLVVRPYDSGRFPPGWRWRGWIAGRRPMGRGGPRRPVRCLLLNSSERSWPDRSP